MKGELLINGKDAWTEWGMKMGYGFLDAIDAPLPMKEYIENESRLEHGKRIITENAKVDSRNFTLEFTITGSTESDYRAKKKAFESELYKGPMTVQIPKLNNEVYRLVYLGKSISYGLSLGRCFGKFSAKFEEPNPTNRGDL